MGYVMKQNLARKENYGSQRNTNDIKWLVIHYTSNDGDSVNLTENTLLEKLLKHLPIIS